VLPPLISLLRFTRWIAVAVVFPLTACTTTDLTSPEIAVAEQRSVSPAIGPTHEIRVFVDDDGKPIGLEAARIRSYTRANFRISQTQRGSRLNHVPANASSLVGALANKSEVVTVAVYRQASIERISGETDPTQPRDDIPIESPIAWIENPDAFPLDQHEAFVDEAINGLVAYGDSVLAEVPYDLLETGYLRAPAIPSLFDTSMQAGEMFSAHDGYVFGQESAPDCTPKKLLAGIAVVGIVAAVAGGVVGIATAAAPTAFVLGNITGMVLPSAATVIAAKTAAYATAAMAGGYLGVAVRDLYDCVRR
jgi:hypothetical protein